MKFTQLRKRLFPSAPRSGVRTPEPTRRKRAAFETLEGRDLLAAAPVCGDAADAPAAVVAEQRAEEPVAGIGDLNDWQSNYGVGAAPSTGGGVDVMIADIDGDGSASFGGAGLDVLIANTGGDRAVDEAILAWGNDWIVGGTGQDAPLAPTTKLKVFLCPSDTRHGDDVRIGGLGRDLILGGAGDDAATGNGGTVSDDVIVDGRIITGENYDSANATLGNETLASSGQTMRLRIATVNNSGK
jgi:Ca2+-binding RTX toxin-like protein